MATSKIAVDLRARTFEIEVPDGRVDEVLNRLEALFKLPVPADLPHKNAARAEETSGEEVPREDDNGKVDSDSGGKKRSKSAIKPKSYNLVDLGLNESQRAAVRDYYAEKNPIQQNDSVAVLGVKLAEFLGRPAFSADEIHSAFKIVNQPTPRNLIAVFGNMKRDGRAAYSDNKVHINSHTEDYVNFHMKKSQDKKKS
ncbi:hypothetical protein [Sphingopyxis fribergensis]